MIGLLIICGIIYLTLFIIKYYKKKLQKTKGIQAAKNIILIHQDELALKRSQLTINRGYNLIDNTKWENEKLFFLMNVIIPESKIIADIKQEVLNYIEEVTSNCQVPV